MLENYIKSEEQARIHGLELADGLVGDRRICKWQKRIFRFLLANSSSKVFAKVVVHVSSLLIPRPEALLPPLSLSGHRDHRGTRSSNDAWTSISTLAAWFEFPSG